MYLLALEDSNQYLEWIDYPMKFVICFISLVFQLIHISWKLPVQTYSSNSPLSLEIPTEFNWTQGINLLNSINIKFLDIKIDYLETLDLFALRVIF